MSMRCLFRDFSREEIMRIDFLHFRMEEPIRSTREKDDVCVCASK